MFDFSISSEIMFVLTIDFYLTEGVHEVFYFIKDDFYTGT